MASAISVTEVATAPIKGQKTGTSGLRKRVTEFQSKNYLNNWIQVGAASLLNVFQLMGRFPVPL